MQIFREAQKIWTQMSANPDVPHTNFDAATYNKLLAIFSIGDYYYYIFNVRTVELEFFSPNAEKILGYKQADYNVAFMLELIHPEDMAWFLDFEATSIDFLKSLPIEKVMKYKIRYDYRMRKGNGEYIRVLHQVITIEQSEEGEIIRTLGVHTDITDIKKEGKPVLSFIGLEGEPSYVNVKPKTKFIASVEIFSKREKEIIKFLIEGKTSIEIAASLFISLHTVIAHRRNILRKANCKRVTELVSHAINMGYI